MGGVGVGGEEWHLIGDRLAGSREQDVQLEQWLATGTSEASKSEKMKAA